MVIAMDFFTSVKTCLLKYVDFNGRSSRSEFWYFFLFYFLLSVCAEIIDLEITGESFWVNAGFGPSQSIVLVLFILPSIAVCARRLHDVGKSGWWQIIHITIIGSIPIFLWCALRSDQNINRYGSPDDNTITDRENKTSKSLLSLVFVSSLIYSFGMGIIVLNSFGGLPPISVVTGDNVSSYGKASLITDKILREDEEIKFFYTPDAFSFTSNGAVLTDRGLTVYETDEDGSLQLSRMTFSQIQNVKMMEQSFGYVVYKVEGNEKSELDWVLLVLDPAGGEYKNFVQNIKNYID